MYNAYGCKNINQLLWLSSSYEYSVIHSSLDPLQSWKEKKRNNLVGIWLIYFLIGLLIKFSNIITYIYI